ncbi:guanylate kinase [Breznakia pachnodae]|uniref:Guanylate kinase n=1 Tax=Breznakia pachnodae TaxID=265178 RepID=A0ABU0DXI1_9FIRM|nr:guanylate kinase [Breznakia pachnodae]MDQ0359354.1 guanylate kinase [Breznakia pachnodae]
MKKGLLIIISGPSGVGKGTVRDFFMKDNSLNLTYSISMTTRKPRENEVDGVDYLFVSKEAFEKAIENGELLEWAEFVGNYYGTPLCQVERLRNEGKNVLLEIEVQGAQQVSEKVPDAITIFMIPPTMDELENRIRGRKSEAEEVIQERLAKAEKEMKLIKDYKYVVCNDDPELAAQYIGLIVKRHMNLAKDE